jgi:hypothetical protein
LTKVIFLTFFERIEENSFWIFFSNLAISGILFLLFFIIFSEFLQDKNYRDFKKKMVKIFF